MQPEAPQTEKPWKELLTRIWNAIHRRPIPKLVALLLAIIFWVLIVASDPTLTIEKTIVNAPVTVVGQDALRTTKGLTVIDDISTGTITVKMRVQVRQSLYNQATAENIAPQLNLSSQITQAGENQPVYFTAGSTSYGTVLSFEPEFITLDVEPYIQRSRIQVVVQQTGESETPLYVESAIPDPLRLVVSGPKSLIDRVQRAVVQLPLSSLSPERTTDSLSAYIELQDADGAIISSPQIRITSESINVDSARIDVTVYPMREVPISTESMIIGVPAHGYRLDSVRMLPETVAVAGPQAVLDELETLYLTASIDVSGMTESFSTTAALRSVSGTVFRSVDEVTVEASIVPAEHVHAYNDLGILVMGIAPGLSATLSHEEMDIILRGDYDEVQGLIQSDITLYVDATGLGAGAHTVDVQCLVNGTEAFSIEPEYPQVTLTLSRDDAAG